MKNLQRNLDMPQCYSDSAVPVLRPTSNTKNWLSMANVQLYKKNL